MVLYLHDRVLAVTVAAVPLRVQDGAAVLLWQPHHQVLADVVGDGDSLVRAFRRPDAE